MRDPNYCAAMYSGQTRYIATLTLYHLCVELHFYSYADRRDGYKYSST